jgi:hypothetical protein
MARITVQILTGETGFIMAVRVKKLLTVNNPTDCFLMFTIVLDIIRYGGN